MKKGNIKCLAQRLALPNIMFVFILLVFLLYSQEFHSPECCRFCNGSHKCGQWGLITDHVVIPWKVCG